MKRSSRLRQRPVRSGASAVLAGFFFTGCAFAESSLDTVVYFDNKTDQTLWVRSKSAPDVQDDYLRIKPLRTTQLRLVAQGRCTFEVVITDSDGKVVKDPGEVCWHATVTVP